jgi:hypothetical protein
MEQEIMTSSYFIEFHKSQIRQLSDDDLEDKFELYKSLRSRSVQDEIVTELLAQELDQREHNKEYA